MDDNKCECGNNLIAVYSKRVKTIVDKFVCNKCKQEYVFVEDI